MGYAMIFSALSRVKGKQKPPVQFEWLSGDTSLSIAEEVCIMTGRKGNPWS
jgi:hypothetical protein